MDVLNGQAPNIQAIFKFLPDWVAGAAGLNICQHHPWHMAVHHTIHQRVQRVLAHLQQMFVWLLEVQNNGCWEWRVIRYCVGTGSQHRRCGENSPAERFTANFIPPAELFGLV